MPLLSHDGDPPGKKRKMPDGAEDAVTGAKVFVLPSGSVPINSHITQMVDTIKPLICQLVEEANLVSSCLLVFDFHFSYSALIVC